MSSLFLTWPSMSRYQIDMDFLPDPFLRASTCGKDIKSPA